MRSITLNRLQRIGIVLSVLIFLTGFFYSANIEEKRIDSDMAFHTKILVDQEDSQRDAVFAKCAKEKAPEVAELQYCYAKYVTELKAVEDRYKAEADKIVAQSIKDDHSLRNSANYALVLLALFWLLAFVIIKVYRWVMKGQP